MDELSWLKNNVRPMIALVIILTLSLGVLLSLYLPPWYVKWGGGIIFFYFGARQWEKFISRKK